MKHLWLMGLAGFLCLGAGMSRADLAAEPVAPPQEKVLTGTLSWEKVVKPDGSTVNRRLLLTAGDVQIALPLLSPGGKVRSSTAGETIDATPFVGKPVKVTAMVVETTRRSGTLTTVKSVTRIEEGS